MSNLAQSYFEKLTFLWGHFTPILNKFGSMLINSPKKGFEANRTKRRVKNKNNTVYLIAISKFEKFEFLTHKMSKTDIVDKTFYKIQFVFEISRKNGVCYRTSCLPRPCPILRKSTNIWYPNRPKTIKNTYPYFQLPFLEVLENSQSSKWYHRIRTGKLNRKDRNYSSNNQL